MHAAVSNVADDSLLRGVSTPPSKEAPTELGWISGT